jgi:thioredoxin 1
MKEQGGNMAAYDVNGGDLAGLTAKGTVLVEFGAPWCGPCKSMEKVLDEVAAAAPQAFVLKVDIDKFPGAARDAGVRSVPTMVLYKDGKKVGDWVGTQKKEVLVQAIAG